MGDSLTAAYGNGALNLLQVLVENRGMSWSGGGQGSWREFLTLPNVLKAFNANVTGFAARDALSHERASRFNVAEGAAMSRDMPHQARNLVKRMRTDALVDMQRHWKVVTLMIGANDFCLELCYTADARATARRHGADLRAALDVLQAAVPRALVNLVLVPNLQMLMNFTGRPALCKVANSAECPCLLGLAHRHRRAEFLDTMRLWQLEEKRVARDPRYHQKDDFTVVLQPFTEEIMFPTKSNGVTDYSFLSEDCFHLSQKGNAYAANGLWNNMLEPVGSKSKTWSFPLFSRFLCPSEERPFIFTAGNSAPADSNAISQSSSTVTRRHTGNAKG